ncbi:hypothetical protein TNCV_4562031 [Trichonephila clavipes]|nr:hypothetical protein TNCV_4562031 [Trichonephila clavipes]
MVISYVTISDVSHLNLSVLYPPRALKTYSLRSLFGYNNGNKEKLSGREQTPLLTSRTDDPPSMGECEDFKRPLNTTTDRSRFKKDGERLRRSLPFLLDII